MNRFRKPQPVSPMFTFRCEYIGETTFEVEARDRDQARRMAEDMMREEMFDAFSTQSICFAPEEKRLGPAEWNDALKLAEQGDTAFDRVAVEVGSSYWWLTNGCVAVIGTGPQPVGVKAAQMVAYSPGAQLHPEARVDLGHRNAVRMGHVAWAQERYLWLVEELFGRCEWHQNAADAGALLAVRDGQCVAVVMRYKVDAKREDPFVEESAS